VDRKLNILMLEDDAADAGLIQKLLQRAGLDFSATVVSDEKHFLSALDKEKFDLVLADNALPQYNSVEALNVVKSKDPFAGFILVTGTVSEEFAVEVIKQGADDYILKSNLTRLPAAINKVIVNRELQEEKNRAAKESVELNKQLRDLTAYLQNIREQEQIRLSREIHDEIGQLLTVLRFSILTIEKKIQRSPIEAKTAVTDALKILETTVVTVRRISAGLRPPVLDDLGLMAALEWQTMEVQKHANIHLSFQSTIPSNIDIEKNIATALFRIYQESLNNILKHADATHIVTTCSLENNEIILSVSDNGKGFDTSKIKTKKTLGLLGMKERVILLNGQFLLNSSPGMGTDITVKIPWTP
jgi:signal transduction histidine kinase